MENQAANCQRILVLHWDPGEDSGRISILRAKLKLEYEAFTIPFTEYDFSFLRL